MKIDFNKTDYEKYMSLFLAQNSFLNLISKNEEKFLWEKHVCDSLSISLFFDKYLRNLSGLKLLDIGTGGGFPAVPISIAYPKIEVTALDSINKKLKAIENIVQSLGLLNITTLNARAENLSEQFDIVTMRAVGRLNKIVHYALPLTKKGGYFVAYKSKSVTEEIKEAQKDILKFSGKLVDIIEYQLPTDEIYDRNLIVIKKN